MEDLKIVCYADIEAEPVRWLWEPYIARGKPSVRKNLLPANPLIFNIIGYFDGAVKMF